MSIFLAKTAVWSSLDAKEKGFECVWFNGSSASGNILRLDEDEQPVHLTYRFHWSDGFRLQEAALTTRKGDQQLALNLRYDGGWLRDGKRLAEFDACTDLDLWPTPLTNTFAICRLNLAIGENRTIDTLWIHGPTMRLEKVSQIYMRTDNSHYVFEDPAANFRANLSVDEEGLVMVYPKLFQRENWGAGCLESDRTR